MLNSGKVASGNGPVLRFRAQVMFTRFGEKTRMLRGRNKGAFESHRSSDRHRLKMSLSRHELHADHHELVPSFGDKKKTEKICFVRTCGRALVCSRDSETKANETC